MGCRYEGDLFLDRETIFSADLAVFRRASPPVILEVILFGESLGVNRFRCARALAVALSH